MRSRLLYGVFALLLLVALLPTVSAQTEPLTQAETELTAEGELGAGCSECSLGSLVADAVRGAAGTDFALVPAMCLSGTLEGGAVFDSDLQRVIPEDEALFVCAVTLPELKAFLELSVGRMVTDESERIIAETSSWEGFLQVSGFSWDYDVSAPSGKRVLHLHIDGREVDLSEDSAVYTLGVPAPLVDGTLGYPELTGEAAGLTLRGALRDYCLAHESLSEPESRSNALGTASYPLLERLPVSAIIAACVIVALFTAIPQLKEKKHFTFR